MAYIDVEVGFSNPYRPGAGHMPPHLAGREHEYAEYDQLIEQTIILNNLILTGLRGVGKTVLLDTFKPRGISKGWLWVGTDLSESASVSENTMAIRLLTDLAVATAGISVTVPADEPLGFGKIKSAMDHFPLTYGLLMSMYEQQPGLVADKLRAVLLFAAQALRSEGRERVVFAYDEAQNLGDNAQRNEYPLSVMLDVFQSLQKKGVPFLLILTGLPTLFPKLVEARTYTERMFRVLTLTRLEREESWEAITKPLDVAGCPIRFDDSAVATIIEESGGYPYFIQFICREIFDIWIQQLNNAEEPRVPIEAIQHKLDTDFFAGRWDKATDRQRQLLQVIASLDNADDEFTIQEIVAKGKELLVNPFSASHANQMLAALAARGLVYKNRFGNYSFAVPLMGGFIRRINAPTNEPPLPF
jgi:hypothetical protein